MDNLLKAGIVQYVAGMEAPEPDTTQPLKLWKDPAAAQLPPDATVTYSVYPADGTAVVQISMRAALAASFNIPGHSSYPPAPVVETVAYYSDGNGGNHGGVPAVNLCLKSAAQALLEDLGWDDAILTDTLGGGQINYGTERGRAWGFIHNGLNYLAAGLIAAKNANGLGAPGHWDTSASPIQWVSDIPAPPQPAPGPALPFPLRDLQPGEEYHIVSGLMGSYVQIVVGLSQPTPYLLADQLRAQRIEQNINVLTALVQQLQQAVAKLGGK